MELKAFITQTTRNARKEEKFSGAHFIFRQEVRSRKASTSAVQETVFVAGRVKPLKSRR